MAPPLHPSPQVRGKLASRRRRMQRTSDQLKAWTAALPDRLAQQRADRDRLVAMLARHIGDGGIEEVGEAIAGMRDGAEVLHAALVLLWRTRQA